MSHHMDERNTPELNSLLEAHHLATDTPSHLADAFRLGYWASQAEIARLQDEVAEWKSHAIKRAQERNVAFNRIEALQLERDTAWNDAIEAAISVVMDDSVEDSYTTYAASIRALKRPVS